MLNRDSVLRQEDRLRSAMLAGDVAELDRLLSPSLVFSFFTGELVGKEQDLEAHRSGAVRFRRLDTSEQRVRVYGSTAVVVVRADIAVSFAGQESEGAFRYLRVWAEEDGMLRIVAGSINPIAAASSYAPSPA